MSATIVDVPYNWRRAKGVSPSPKQMPGVEELLRDGIPSAAHDTDDLSVFLPYGSYGDPIALRNWIDTYVEGGCALFATFSYEKHEFSVPSRNFLGFRFRFVDEASSIYFRLRWEQPVNLAA